MALSTYGIAVSGMLGERNASAWRIRSTEAPVRRFFSAVKVSPTLTKANLPALPTYVIGSTIRAALPVMDSARATAPALPAPEAALPAPPVKMAVTALKVTAPAARDGLVFQVSQATRALPVSFMVVRDSRSQVGSLSSGAVQ